MLTSSVSPIKLNFWKKRSFKRHPLWVTTREQLYEDREKLLFHSESSDTREWSYYRQPDTLTGAQARETTMIPDDPVQLCFHQHFTRDNSPQLPCNKSTFGAWRQRQQWGTHATHERCWWWKGRSRGRRGLMRSQQKQGKIAQLTYRYIPGSALWIFAECLEPSLDLYSKKTNGSTVFKPN